MVRYTLKKITEANAARFFNVFDLFGTFYKLF